MYFDTTPDGATNLRSFYRVNEKTVTDRLLRQAGTELIRLVDLFKPEIKVVRFSLNPWKDTVEYIGLDDLGRPQIVFGGKPILKDYRSGKFTEYDTVQWVLRKVKPSFKTKEKVGHLAAAHEFAHVLVHARTGWDEIPVLHDSLFTSTYLEVLTRGGYTRKVRTK